MRRKALSVALLLSLWPAIGSASSAENRQLISRYQVFSTNLKPVVTTMPLHISSTEVDGRLDVDVFGIIDQPFRQVAATLAAPQSVCEFLLLNLNVKACTYRNIGDSASLKIYVAGKGYTPPYRSLTIEPLHRVNRRSADYLAMALVAQKGIMGSSDYKVLTEIAPYRQRTLVRVSSSYQGSRLSHMAIQAYLRTFARDKIGFSVTGQDADDKPVYIRGLRAVIERNVVRSYMALQAHLEHSQKRSRPEQFEQRIRRWYDLTETYAMQLREVERERYFYNKRREYRNQLRLQTRLDRRSRDVTVKTTTGPESGQRSDAVFTTK
jgi:hypothetical protein